MDRFLKANTKYLWLILVVPMLVFSLVLVVRKYNHTVSTSPSKSEVKKKKVEFNQVSLASSGRGTVWQGKIEKVNWRHQSSFPFTYYYLSEGDSLEVVKVALQATYDWAENLIVTHRDQPIKAYVFPNWGRMTRSLGLGSEPKTLIWPHQGIVTFLSSEKGPPDQLAAGDLISFLLRERMKTPPLWLELGLRQLALQRIATGVEISRGDGDLREILSMDKASFSSLGDAAKKLYQARCGGLIKFIVDERGQEGARMAVDAASSGFEGVGILEFALREEFGKISLDWGRKVASTEQEPISEGDNLRDKYKRSSKFVILVYVLSVAVSIVGIVVVYYFLKR